MAEYQIKKTGEVEKILENAYDNVLAGNGPRYRIYKRADCGFAVPLDLHPETTIIMEKP